MKQEEEDRVNKVRQEVSDEKQRQMDELAKESEEKKKLLEELDDHESKHAAALARHEAENQIKLDKLKKEYEERERELEAQVCLCSCVDVKVQVVDHAGLHHEPVGGSLCDDVIIKSSAVSHVHVEASWTRASSAGSSGAGGEEGSLLFRTCGRYDCAL